MFKKIVFGVCFLAVLSFCALSFAAETINSGKTQGEFAVQLCNAMGLEVTDDNYIGQLEAKGIIPAGGWQADKTISNEEMGTLLSKSLGLEQEIEARVAKKVDEAYRDKATVIRFEGNVEVKPDKDQKWIPAEVGMKLTEADSIKTGDKSWIELRVGMVGGIKISENSELNLSELSSKPNGSENIILFMSIGEMLVDVRGLNPDSDFQVRTPTTVAAVRGTVYNIKVFAEETEIIEAK